MKRLGPHHKDGCDNSVWRYSGTGYNRVKICACGAEDHAPDKESLNRLGDIVENFIKDMKKE